MRKVLMSFLILFLVLFFGLSFIPFSHITEALTLTGNSVSTPNTQVIDESVYAFGQSVTVSGVIHGDVICAGQNVTIAATVTGDVLCAAQTIHIQGTVDGNIRVAAQNIDVTGVLVQKNMNVFGQVVTVEPSSTIQNDVIAYAQSLTLQGKIGRDINAGASTFLFDAVGARNVTIQDQDLKVSKNSLVRGNFTYQSTKAAVIENPKGLLGKVSHTYPPAPKKSEDSSPFISSIISLLFTILGTLILCLIAGIFFHDFIAITNSQVTKKPLQTFGMGLLFLIIPPIVIILLVITLIGIPLAISLLASWILLLIFGHILPVFWMTGFIMEKVSWSRFGFYLLFLGIIILLSILFMIPFLGGLLSFLVTCFGVGSIVYSIASLRTKLAIQQVSVPPVQI